MRAKAKFLQQAEGGKSTQYYIFYIFGKKYTKLILENKHKISDPKDIRNEQKQFYNKLQNLQNKGLNSFINIIKIFIFM